MKTILIAIAATIALLGCSPSENNKYNVKHVSLVSRNDIKVVCLDGVEYYWAWRRLAVRYTPDGKVSLCKENP